MDTFADQHLVASCSTREEAIATLERLAAEGFPVRSAAIVGRGVHFVEDVTGRQTPKRTVGTVTVGCGVLAALVSVLMAVASGEPPGMTFRAAVLGAVAGLAIGLVVGTLLYRLGWPRRLRSSGLVATASRYDIVADPCLAPGARELVGSAPGDDRSP